MAMQANVRLVFKNDESGERVSIALTPERTQLLIEQLQEGLTALRRGKTQSVTPRIRSEWRLVDYKPRAQETACSLLKEEEGERDAQ